MRTIKLSNGDNVRMDYEDVCHKLRIIPWMNFVEITTRGTITFTLGKPDEICYLYHAVEKAGFVPAKTLKDAVKQIRG